MQRIVSHILHCGDISARIVYACNLDAQPALHLALQSKRFFAWAVPAQRNTGRCGGIHTGAEGCKYWSHLAVDMPLRMPLYASKMPCRKRLLYSKASSLPDCCCITDNCCRSKMCVRQGPSDCLCPASFSNVHGMRALCQKATLCNFALHHTHFKQACTTHARVVSNRDSSRIVTSLQIVL